MYELGILIGIILGIGINYWIATEFYKVAEAKAWYDKKYFWITFFIMPIGILLIIALPDRIDA